MLRLVNSKLMMSDNDDDRFNCVNFRALKFMLVNLFSDIDSVFFIIYFTLFCFLSITITISNGVSVKIFADDTKLYSVFNNNMTPARLQLCLTAISE